MTPLTPQGHAAGLDVGVMLLDNDLPRPVGDVGNARTLGAGVAYDVIHGAATERVLEHEADGLLDRALEAGGRLRRLGVRTLSTCCGFLAILQRELAAGLDVPVATSSLLQVPLVLQTLAPDRHVGVITVNGSTLRPAHLEAVGIDAAARTRVSIHGLEHTEHFFPMIMGEVRALDVSRARSEVVATAVAALDADPQIGAFVLECTNLPPYADAIRRRTGLPVWDATSLIHWLRAGVSEDRFEAREVGHG